MLSNKIYMKLCATAFLESISWNWSIALMILVYFIVNSNYLRIYWHHSVSNGFCNFNLPRNCILCILSHEIIILNTCFDWTYKDVVFSRFKFFKKKLVFVDFWATDKKYYICAHICLSWTANSGFSSEAKISKNLTT